MSEDPKIELTVGEKPGEHSLTINGVELSNVVGLPLKVEVDEMGYPRVVLNLTQAKVTTRLSAQAIRFDEQTESILLAAGWVPPHKRVSVTIDGRQIYGVMQNVNKMHGGR